MGVENLVSTVTKQFVRCDGCDQEMRADSEQFFTFLGNVNIGLNGGIIGNSLDQEGRVTRGLVYCFACTDRIMADAKNRRE